MKTNHFVVMGDPVARQAPKVRRVGKGARLAPHSESIKWTRQIALIAKAHKPAALLTEPLRGEAVCYVKRPKSKPEKKFPFPNVRPDCDNFGKNIWDALNGIIYKDDGCLVDMTVKKRYGKPRVEIKIMTMGSE